MSQCSAKTARGTRCRRTSAYMIPSLPDHSDIEAACEQHRDKIAQMVEANSGLPATVMPDFDVDDLVAHIDADAWAKTRRRAMRIVRD